MLRVRKRTRKVLVLYPVPRWLPPNAPGAIVCSGFSIAAKFPAVEECTRGQTISPGRETVARTVPEQAPEKPAEKGRASSSSNNSA